jgi:hypothetical protein
LEGATLGALDAVGYAINQRSRLELFLTDARIPLHDNGSERRLRVVALGRKNYLFVGHARAGRNIAGLYSLVGSCIANGVEPTEYLIDVLPRIAAANSNEALDALLPDRWGPTGPAPWARPVPLDNHGLGQTVTLESPWRAAFRPLGVCQARSLSSPVTTTPFHNQRRGVNTTNPIPPQLVRPFRRPLPNPIMR